MALSSIRKIFPHPRNSAIASKTGIINRVTTKRAASDHPAEDRIAGAISRAAVLRAGARITRKIRNDECDH
jgi:hypothetical protein